MNDQQKADMEFVAGMDRKARGVEQAQNETKFRRLALMQKEIRRIFPDVFSEHTNIDDPHDKMRILIEKTLLPLLEDDEIVAFIDRIGDPNPRPGVVDETRTTLDIILKKTVEESEILKKNSQSEI